MFLSKEAEKVERPHKRTTGIPPAVLERNSRSTDFLDKREVEPRRLRRTFTDGSNYLKDNFLYHENAQPWQESQGSRDTRFYKGFYRRQVNDVGAVRKQCAETRDAVAESRRPGRRAVLEKNMGQSTLTAESMSAPNRQHGGRRHYSNNDGPFTSTIVLAGPDTVEARGPYPGPRLERLARGGRPTRSEGVADMFTNMHGY